MDKFSSIDDFPIEFFVYNGLNPATFEDTVAGHRRTRRLPPKKTFQPAQAPDQPNKDGKHPWENPDGGFLKWWYPKIYG